MEYLKYDRIFIYVEVKHHDEIIGKEMDQES